MIEELIYNLCDNAIRYNNYGGKVDVSVKKTAEGVLLCVEDTGIGISEKDRDRIFEGLYWVDKSRSKQTGGTGLGLAIVKHIAVLHDARIQVDSKPGAGTKIKK
ncbi:MAG: ATP-binding protein [Eubacterium sp.]